MAEVKLKRDHRRPEVLPPLPDPQVGFDDLSPHPDGRPWRKACDECAFRRNDPQYMGEAGQAAIREGQPGTNFYCAHRYDEGHHRVCACYAACQAGRAVIANMEADDQGGERNG